MKQILLSLSLLLLPAAHAADEVKGGLDKTAIDSGIKKDLGKFADCYAVNTKDLKVKPRGKMRTHFVVGADGKVSKADIVSSELKNEKLEACVGAVIQALTFTAPVGGGTVEVEYPFYFEPPAKDSKKKR